MKDKCYLQTPIGVICIEGTSQAVTALYPAGDYAAKAMEQPRTEVLRMAAEQLMEYFQGRRKRFTVPLEPEGTEFQKKVWRALCDIPYGETRSYGEIAASIGNPQACRAVGGANNKNSIIIFIPCHRVIGANGSLVGFGCGLDMKQYLLEHEKRWRGEDKL